MGTSVHDLVCEGFRFRAAAGRGRRYSPLPPAPVPRYAQGMKRKWRIGRVVLAGVLLGSAVLILALACWAAVGHPG